MADDIEILRAELDRYRSECTHLRKDVAFYRSRLQEKVDEENEALVSRVEEAALQRLKDKAKARWAFIVAIIAVATLGGYWKIDQLIESGIDRSIDAEFAHMHGLKDTLEDDITDLLAQVKASQMRLAEYSDIVKEPPSAISSRVAMLNALTEDSSALQNFYAMVIQHSKLIEAHKNSLNDLDPRLGRAEGRLADVIQQLNRLTASRNTGGEP